MPAAGLIKSDFPKKVSFFTTCHRLDVVNIKQSLVMIWAFQTFVVSQNHALHHDFDFLFCNASWITNNIGDIGFVFFVLFFWSGLRWYWILISAGNGKHQCTTAPYGHKRKGHRREISPPSGYHLMCSLLGRTQNTPKLFGTWVW